MNIKNNFFEEILFSVKKISIEAGKIILDVYSTDFFESIENKKDDSPVTVADKKSNEYIVKRLQLLTPDIPIVSEESEQLEYASRKKFDFFWLVDPLDGTKEFINRNGDFTVNIALIQKNRPIMGVVYIPVEDKLYWAIEGKGAFMEYEGFVQRLKAGKVDLNKENLKILVSRSHFDDKTKAYLEKFDKPVVMKRGSALKFLLIAEGKGDVYFRFTPTMEWDTAASHIILKEAGANVLNIETNEELEYNKESMINPGFIAIAQ